VSTDKQADYNYRNQADIPIQRKARHRFAEEKGWTIIHEEQEDGASGHKVQAENRDKLHIIKAHTKQKKFDVLLVFMFDRIERIVDEPPFCGRVVCKKRHPGLEYPGRSVAALLGCRNWRNHRIDTKTRSFSGTSFLKLFPKVVDTVGIEPVTS